MHTASFADGQLTDALKNIAGDPNADKRVKKKLMLVLGSWHDQFKSDPSMSLVAGLYRQCRPSSTQDLNYLMGLHNQPTESERKKAKREKEEARERERVAEEDRRRKEQASRNRRAPFDFDKVDRKLGGL